MFRQPGAPLFFAYSLACSSPDALLSFLFTYRPFKPPFTRRPDNVVATLRFVFSFGRRPWIAGTNGELSARSPPRQPHWYFSPFFTRHSSLPHGNYVRFTELNSASRVVPD